MRDHDVSTFIESYGRALSEGDIAKIVSAWEVPALVASDEGTMNVTELDQVKDFFTGAVADYRSRGISSTHPEDVRIEALSDKVSLVHVRWPNLDASGHTTSEESTTYILRADDSGHPHICVALNA